VARLGDTRRLLVAPAGEQVAPPALAFDVGPRFPIGAGHRGEPGGGESSPDLGGVQEAESTSRRPGGKPTMGSVAFERITVNPDQMGGLPCIRGLRVTVSAVVGQLAAGRTIDEILEDYPYLERDDIFAALEYAAAAVSERELPTPAA
jgi:uncharacterized protein (DUF433 family)